MSRNVKKILVVLNDWPWNMAGGSNYHTIKIIQYWTHYWNYHDIDVLVPRLGYGYAQRQLDVKGNAIVTDSFFEREASTLFGRVLLICSRILRVLRSPPQKKYDDIIASSHYLTDVLPSVYLHSRNPSSKLIAYYHSALVSEKSVGMFFLRKLNDAISVPLLRKYADLIFAMNEPIKDSLIARGVDEKRILITNNGVDEIVHEAESPVPVFDACFVGRLERGKGIFDLVRIWKAVSSEIPTAKLVMIGDGSEKDRLTKLIEREHLTKNITLCGFVEETTKFDILRKSTLFVLPSSVDAWGIVIAEAMSCGVPVIVYDLPAFRTIWGSTIVYVPEGDKRVFAETVVKLLEDAQLRSELSKNGLKRLRELLWVDIAKYEANAIENA
jgi:glycosyltransferase involved in cell wall biosynthesis